MRHRNDLPKPWAIRTPKPTQRPELRLGLLTEAEIARWTWHSGREDGACEHGYHDCHVCKVPGAKAAAEPPKAEDVLPEGWYTPYENKHIHAPSRAAVMFNDCRGDWGWWAPDEGYRNPDENRATRAEAMAAALGFTVEPHAEIDGFYWAHKSPPNGIQASRGGFASPEEAACHALAFDADQRRKAAPPARDPNEIPRRQEPGHWIFDPTSNGFTYITGGKS